MDEAALEELALRRAAEKGCELVVREPWSAAYEKDDPILGGRLIVQSAGPYPTRAEALKGLLAADDLMAQADDHTE